MSLEAIQTRTALSESELWLLLGQEISPGLGSRDPKFLIAAAKAWFDARISDIRTAVCGNGTVTQARASEDRGVLLSALYDVIAPLLGGIPAATVTVLILRYGLDRLCGPAERV